jgi:hypothetical protein
MPDYISKFASYIFHGETRGLFLAGLGLALIYTYAPEKTRSETQRAAAVVDSNLCNEVRLSMRESDLERITD